MSMGPTFLCTIRAISRGQGRVSVAFAAYITRSRLRHEREDRVYDWRHVTDCVHQELIGAPTGWDRERLWNDVEWHLVRWDAVTAREAMILIPYGVREAEAIRISQTIAGDMVHAYGCAADIALHRTDGPDGEPAYHLHLMWTAMHVDETGLGGTIQALHERGSDRGEQVRRIRQAVADRINGGLRRLGRTDRVDPRSYEARGIRLVPTTPLGPRLSALEAAGARTRLGDRNRAARLANDITRLAPDFDGRDWVARGCPAADLVHIAGQLRRDLRDLREVEGAIRRGEASAPHASQPDVEAHIEHLRLVLAQIGRRTRPQSVEERRLAKRQQKLVRKSRRGRGGGGPGLGLGRRRRRRSLGL